MANKLRLYRVNVIRAMYVLATDATTAQAVALEHEQDDDAPPTTGTLLLDGLHDVPLSRRGETPWMGPYSDGEYADGMTLEEWFRFNDRTNHGSE